MLTLVLISLAVSGQTAELAVLTAGVTGGISADSVGTTNIGGADRPNG